MVAEVGPQDKEGNQLERTDGDREVAAGRELVEDRNSNSNQQSEPNHYNVIVLSNLAPSLEETPILPKVVGPFHY